MGDCIGIGSGVNESGLSIDSWFLRSDTPRKSSHENAMLSALAAGFLLGLTAGLAPGPLMALVITQSLRHGTREGWPLPQQRTRHREETRTGNEDRPSRISRMSGMGNEIRDINVPTPGSCPLIHVFLCIRRASVVKQVSVRPVNR